MPKSPLPSPHQQEEPLQCQAYDHRAQQGRVERGVTAIRAVGRQQEEEEEAWSPQHRS